MRSMTCTLLLCLLTGAFSARAQYKGESTLSYETPRSQVGLARANVSVRWEVVNVMGGIGVKFSAGVYPDYTEFLYGGRTYRSEGDDAPLFRKISGSRPVVVLHVTGPGFDKQIPFENIGSLGDGVFMGNGKSLDYTPKNKDDRDPKNWSVRPVIVKSISWDNTFELQALIDSRRLAEERKAEFDKIYREAEQAMAAGEYAEAIRQYEIAGRLLPSEPGIQDKITRARKGLQDKTARDQYTDYVKSARNAEASGDRRRAKDLYQKALQTGQDAGQAEQAIERIGAEEATEERERLARQEQLKRKAEEEAAAYERDRESAAAEAAKKREELKEAEEERMKKQRDSVAELLERSEREVYFESLKRSRDSIREADEARETMKRDEEALQKEKDRQRMEGMIGEAENGMSWNPEMYERMVQRADSAARAAAQIRPQDALELKKEWWDNNLYIQQFADDLYESQRQDNMKRYLNEINRSRGAWYRARDLYLAALPFVDRGSPEHDYLLTRIRFAQKNAKEDGDMYKMELGLMQSRPAERALAKRVAAEARMAENFRRAGDIQTYRAIMKGSGYQPVDGLEQYKTAERFNRADQKYQEESALLGAGQSVALDAMLDDSKEAQSAGNGAMMINFYVAGALAYESIPIIVNHTADGGVPETRMEKLEVFPVYSGIDLWLWRSPHIDVGVGGRAMYGLLPMPGTSSSLLGYGYKGRLDFGLRRLKLAGTYEYFRRIGSKEIDYDVAKTNAGYIALGDNHQSEGSFDYSVARIGAGLKVDLMDDEQDAYIMAQIFAEKPSFYPGSFTKNPVYSYGLELLLSQWTFTASYAPNYVIAGDAKYPVKTAQNRAFWAVRFGRTWTILNTSKF